MTAALATTNLLPSLALLACPIGMGLMMWMMARGSKRSSDAAMPGRPASLEVLREEHRRLAAEIERLEGDRTDTPGAKPSR